MITIRDYIHVLDLAEAHVLALESLIAGMAGGAFNVGTGHGHSVREVIEMARKVTGRPIPAVESPRRIGDPAVLVADASLIQSQLGWQPRYSLQDIVESAWRWHAAHPNGF